MAEQARRAVENSLNAIMVAASSLLDPSRLAGVAVSEVRRVLGVDGSSLTFWDEEFGVLVPLAFDDARIAEPWPVYFPGQGLIGQAFGDGRSVVAEDYRQTITNPPVWSEVRCGIAVPLFADGRLLGSLSAQHYSPRTFAQADLELLELIADQVGPALGTMRTLARAQLRTAQAYALATLMRRGAVLCARDDRVYTLIGDAAVRLLGAELAGLVLRDTGDEAPGWHGVVGNRTDAFSGRHYGLEHRAAETIFGGQMRVVRGDGGGEFDPERFPFFAAEGIRTGVALPLNETEDSRGALCLGWRSEVQLPDALLDFAQALAGFASSLVQAAALRTQRDALVGNAPVMLAALDADGVLTLCEGAGAEAIGLGPGNVGERLDVALADQPGLIARLPEMCAGAVSRTTLEIRGRIFDTRIVARNQNLLLVATDITERAEAERELARLATEDALTGLPNKSEIIARVSEALARSTVTVVLADIRSFDQVNEAIGYDAADELLRSLGTRLAAELHDAVVVGRIEGDEFAVAALGEDADRLCERARESLEAFVGDDTSEQISVDVRCGVASMAAGRDPKVLLQNADSALQLARRGGHPISVWQPQMAERLRSRASLTGELRRALATRSFDVAYQPIVDARDGTIASVEALARWTLPTGEPVSPDVFVPLAESIGRIHRLTEQVLDRALADVAAGCGLPVSVNVCPLELTQASLLQLVRETLSAHGVAPVLLTLELVETSELDQGSSVIDELVQLGVSLSVDDFGRGWSSMELLKRLPARRLKLDRSYVARATRESIDRAITHATIELGHSLGMEVVAEGVEDPATLELVVRLGCDQVQGYHLARPMAVDELRRWLTDRG